MDTRVSYLTTKQNLFFSKMRPDCFRQRDAGDGLSSKRFVTSAGRTHYSLSKPADSRYGGYPSPKFFLLTTAQQKHSQQQQKQCQREACTSPDVAVPSTIVQILHHETGLVRPSVPTHTFFARTTYPFLCRPLRFYNRACVSRTPRSKVKPRRENSVQQSPV